MNVKALLHNKLIEQPIPAQPEAHANERLRYAAAVAAFTIAQLTHGARGDDASDYPAGFVQL